MIMRQIDDKECLTLMCKNMNLSALEPLRFFLLGRTGSLSFGLEDFFTIFQEMWAIHDPYGKKTTAT